MRSHALKHGVARAPHRSLLRALGVTDAEMERPFIGVANSFSEVVPGHVHLRTIVDAVKAGVRAGGGVPFEFGVMGICDGIAMNHRGMLYSLPSRELIADTVESMTLAHAFDALVLVPCCDKIVPGMLMAAMRLDVPAVMVGGGPMLAGRVDDQALDLSSVFEAVGQHQAGSIDDAGLRAVECGACPTCGSCSGMFTANSMNCLAEVVGMALPGNGTIPAVYSERIRLAKESGARVMDVLARDLRPDRILVLELQDDCSNLHLKLHILIPNADNLTVRVGVGLPPCRAVGNGSGNARSIYGHPADPTDLNKPVQKFFRGFGSEESCRHDSNLRVYGFSHQHP